MEQTESVMKDLIDECHDDYVGLSKIISVIRQSFDQKDVVETTLTVISRLLQQDIVAGQFYDNKFPEWQMSNDQTMEKIKSDWARLGREPTPGDVVWLTAKEGLS